VIANILHNVAGARIAHCALDSDKSGSRIQPPAELPRRVRDQVRFVFWLSSWLALQTSRSCSS